MWIIIESEVLFDRLWYFYTDDKRESGSHTYMTTRFMMINEDDRGII